MNDPALLTVREHFLAWERRGRGWSCYTFPVELEPPFRPFEPANLSCYFIDDAARPTILSRIAAAVTRNPPQRIYGALPDPPEPEPDARPIRDDSRERCEFHLLLPPGFEPPRPLSEQLLSALRVCTYPLIFEVLGTPEQVSLLLSADADDARLVQGQLKALLPESTILSADGSVREAWEEASGCAARIVDFGLSNEFVRPLRPLKSFGVDPLSAVVAALTDLDQGEVGILQVMFQPTQAPWGPAILRSVVDHEGKPLWFLPQPVVGLARQKVDSPLYAVAIRAAAATSDDSRSLEVVRSIAGALGQLTDPESNELIPLEESEEMEEGDHEYALLHRLSHRPGMILSLDELTSLVHLPWAALRHPKFARANARTRPAPALASGAGLAIGENEHDGRLCTVSLSPDQRTRHTWIIGASGSGKSVLLLNMALADISAGSGLALIDPHGDLVDELLSRIPPERASDVVVLDPADEEFPVGLNILAAHTELERTLLSSDLVGIFRRFATSWGDQMSTVLGNAILAFLERPGGGTLLDLKRFLSDTKARAEYLKTVSDPEVIYYWQKEFPLLRGSPQASILSRLDVFLRSKLIRRIFCQSRSLDFRRLMDERKILLVKLAQGAIGEDNAFLLGALIVAKLNQAALSRQEVAASDRADFLLYMDEFHNTATPSISSLLEGVRKYRLGLVLAHQNLSQLAARDAGVAAAVEGAYTRIVFRVGDKDARALAGGFSHFEASDLQNLGIGQAVCRVERAEFDFNLRTYPPPDPVEPAEARSRRDQIIEDSRRRYAAPKAEVDAAFAAAFGFAAPEVVEAQVDDRGPARETHPVAPSEAAHDAEPHRDGSVRPPDLDGPVEPVKRPRAPAVPPGLPRAPGRGGREHKYLQGLIKSFGEKEGFRATLEKAVEGGVGIVDVVLELDSCSVACEVAISSGPEQELAHLQNCIAASFTHVAAVSPDKKRLNTLRALATEVLKPSDLTRVQFLAPEQVPEFLAQVAAGLKGSEERIGGYTVRTAYRPTDEAERTEIQKRIARTVSETLRRLRKDDQG